MASTFGINCIHFAYLLQLVPLQLTDKTAQPASVWTSISQSSFLPLHSQSERGFLGNTEKLELPPLNVQTRGHSDVAYYNNDSTQQRPLYVSERYPALPLPQPTTQAYSSSASSPRVNSISSAGSSHAGSQSSFTSAPSSNGPKTPGTLSPTLPLSNGIPGHQGHQGHQGTVAGYDHYPAMNQGGPPPDMYYQQQMSAGQQQPPHPVTAYSTHQQPTLLQPGPQQYPPPPQQYAPYNYANGLTSPQQQGPPQMPGMGNQNVLPLPGVGNQQGMTAGYQAGFDTTGQIAPPGMKPRVTATLWEDEGSLCFQVEARGICVARREGAYTQKIAPSSLVGLFC